VGIIADWSGRRKPFIIAGLVLAGAGAIVMGLAPDAASMLIGRAITGLAAAAWVPLVVVFSSLFPPKEAVRASALLTLINSLSRMLATGITGSLNDLGGYPLAFFVAATVAFCTIVVVVPAREERRAPAKMSPRSITNLVLRRDVILPSLLSAVAQYATWATIFGFLPILAQRMGASNIVQGILVSMNIGIVLLGNILVSFALRRVKAKALVYVSFVILVVGVLIAAFAVSMVYVFVASFLIGLSTGINYPILMGMSIEHIGESERATAMGVYQSVYALGMFIGPWLSGILASAFGIQPMFAVTGFVCLVLAFLGTSMLPAVPGDSAPAAQRQH
jgi:MFS family permease